MRSALAPALVASLLLTPRAVEAGKWIFSRDKDEMTDQETLSAVLIAKSRKAGLIVSCTTDDKKGSLSITSGVSAYRGGFLYPSSRPNVAFRFGKEPQLHLEEYLSNRDSVVLQVKDVALFRRMARKGVLRVRLPTVGGGSRTYTFLLPGKKRALMRVLRCIKRPTRWHSPSFVLTAVEDNKTSWRVHEGDPPDYVPTSRSSDICLNHPKEGVFGHIVFNFQRGAYWWEGGIESSTIDDAEINDCLLRAVVGGLSDASTLKKRSDIQQLVLHYEVGDDLRRYDGKNYGPSPKLEEPCEISVLPPKEETTKEPEDEDETHAEAPDDSAGLTPRERCKMIPKLAEQLECLKSIPR